MGQAVLWIGLKLKSCLTMSNRVLLRYSLQSFTQPNGHLASLAKFAAQAGLDFAEKVKQQFSNI